MNAPWFQFLLLMLFWVLVALVVAFVMRVVLRRIFARTRTKVDDQLLSILDAPILVLIMALGMVETLQVLGVLPDWLWHYVQVAFRFIVSLMAIYLAYRIYRVVTVPLIKDYARRREKDLDKTLVPVLDSLGAIAILFFGGLWVLSYNGINVTVFLAGAGIAGLVLAFALQDTLSNYFSGLYLMMDKPFKERDVIIMNEDYCEVLSVGFRSTRLYNIFKHDMMIVPNNSLANQNIVNKTEPDIHLRISVSVGVAYGSPVAKVKELIMEAVTSEPGVVLDDPDKEVSLRFRNFGDSALEFSTLFFVEDYMEQWRIGSNVRERIDGLFRANGITVPFPQRTVSYLDGKGDAGPSEAPPAPVPA